jgi:hypothetical protein
VAGIGPVIQGVQEVAAGSRHARERQIFGARDFVIQQQDQRAGARIVPGTSGPYCPERLGELD